MLLLQTLKKNNTMMNSTTIGNFVVDKLIESVRGGERDVVLLNEKEMSQLVESGISRSDSASDSSSIRIVNITKDNIGSENELFECFCKALNIEFGFHWDGLFNMLRNYEEDDLRFVFVNFNS